MIIHDITRLIVLLMIEKEESTELLQFCRFLFLFLDSKNVLLLPQKIINKLLGSSSGEPSVLQFPGIGFLEQFLFLHLDTVAFCQSQHDFLESFFLW